MLSPKDIAFSAANVLDQKNARDVKILKIEELTVLANFFVICTASTTTHIKTLTDELEKKLEEFGEHPIRREGYRSGGWILLDYGCVVVHVFLEELRGFYNLERLWGDAEQLEFVPEGIVSDGV